ncbi:MAG: hypothetical protein GXZ09_01675 [Syntrophomonadaceae bacterium]|jgi:CRISPR/Cas system-associated exonuclease Cas4 (RecB family)|nr:hypothetical protein [Syntrophomonadaceae bacterium]
MSALLGELAAAVKKYPWQEKLLLVPSLGDGHQLLEALAREGTAWVNLRPIKPLELAVDIARDRLRSQGLSLAGEEQLLSVLEQVLAVLQEQQQLSYFKPLQDKGILGRVMLNSLIDLRMAGVEPDRIDPLHCVDSNKGEEIRIILAAYIKTITQQGLADAARVYLMAADELAKSDSILKERVVLVPQQLEMPALARQFIERVLKRSGEVLAEEPVLGLSPKRILLSSRKVAPQSALSYLFALEDAPVDRPEVEIFPAYGRSNEVAQILRFIKARNLPLDQVLITAVNSHYYAPLLYAQAHQAGLPATFSEGLPVLYIAPGRFFNGLLQWIQGGWRETSLYRLFISGGTRISRPVEAGRLLRKAGIGWGRERCLPAIEKMLHENGQARANAEATAEQAEIDRLDREKALLDEIYAFLKAVLAAIPAEDENNPFSYSQCCLRLASLLDDWALIDNELAAQGVTALKGFLLLEAQISAVQLSSKDAWKRLQQCLGRLWVGASTPQPGCLHMAGLEHAQWIRRPYVFVLGLDAGAIDQPSLQDSVLLDEERQKISPLLDLSRDEQGRQVYRLTRFLAAQRGKIVLSFPCFDVLEGRACLPSALLLQVYRLITGCFQADYSTLLKSLPPVATYYPDESGQVLTEAEWWLYQTRCQASARVDQAGLLGLYPLLESGLAARDEREKGGITAYDGRLSVDPSELDPRHNQTLVMSASALETMAKCPFSYFLRHVLGIRPPEEFSLEEDLWLDAKNLGSLLHSVYCRFLRDVYGRGQPPDKALLNRYALEEIELFAREIPPPSSIVYELEKQQILQGLEIFWNMLLEQDGKVKPAYFEVPFGMGAEEVKQAGIGSTEALHIPLPSGHSFLLRGKIDRIDSDGQGHYQVWDYKTGSTYSYLERGYVRQGQQIQHVVYSLAAETMLGQDCGQEVIVDQAGYIFPTPRGEGQVRARSRERRDEGLQAVEKILELMGQGIFNATHDPWNCNFCDYRLLCRGSKASEKVRAVCKNTGNHDLDLWRELQQYE